MQNFFSSLSQLLLNLLEEASIITILKVHMTEMDMMVYLQFLGKRLIELFVAQNMVQLFRKSLNTSHRHKVHYIKECRHDI